MVSFQIPKKEMGNAIKYLKSEFPQADGKMISEIVKNIQYEPFYWVSIWK